MPPNSFGEWMMGQNLPSKKKPKKPKETRPVFSLQLETDDESDADILKLTYPRTGPKKQPKSKKVHFTDGSHKVQAKEPPAIVPLDSDTDVSTSGDEETTDDEIILDCPCTNCIVARRRLKKGKQVKFKATKQANESSADDSDDTSPAAVHAKHKAKKANEAQAHKAKAKGGNSQQKDNQKGKQAAKKGNETCESEAETTEPATETEPESQTELETDATTDGETGGESEADPAKSTPKKKGKGKGKGNQNKQEQAAKPDIQNKQDNQSNKGNQDKKGKQGKQDDQQEKKQEDTQRQESKEGEEKSKEGNTTDGRKSDIADAAKSIIHDILDDKKKERMKRKERKERKKKAKAETLPHHNLPPISQQRNLIMPPQNRVLGVEHAFEGPRDPQPNAFYDNTNGNMRVYHGPNHGNPYGMSYPNGAYNNNYQQPLPTGAPQPTQNPYYDGFVPVPGGQPMPSQQPQPEWPQAPVAPGGQPTNPHPSQQWPHAVPGGQPVPPYPQQQWPQDPGTVPGTDWPRRYGTVVAGKEPEFASDPDRKKYEGREKQHSSSSPRVAKSDFKTSDRGGRSNVMPTIEVTSPEKTPDHERNKKPWGTQSVHGSQKSPESQGSKRSGKDNGHKVSPGKEDKSDLRSDLDKMIAEEQAASRSKPGSSWSKNGSKEPSPMPQDDGFNYNTEFGLPFENNGTYDGNADGNNGDSYKPDGNNYNNTSKDTEGDNGKTDSSRRSGENHSADNVFGGTNNSSGGKSGDNGNGKSNGKSKGTKKSILKDKPKDGSKHGSAHGSPPACSLPGAWISPSKSDRSAGSRPPRLSPDNVVGGYRGSPPKVPSDAGNTGEQATEFGDTATNNNQASQDGDNQWNNNENGVTWDNTWEENGNENQNENKNENGTENNWQNQSLAQSSGGAFDNDEDDDDDADGNDKKNGKGKGKKQGKGKGKGKEKGKGGDGDGEQSMW